jgi:L-ascorbate metabolism protein UlaG (beta-lactamase superfamily)
MRAATSRSSPERVRITFLGQSGLLLSAGGETLLIDPYLSDIGRLLDGGMWSRDLPIPMAPHDFAGALAVVCTHEHIDHLDPLTVAPLLACSPTTVLVAPAAAIAQLPFMARRHQLVPVRAEGEALRIGPFTITPLPAAHSEQYTLETTERHGHRWSSVVVEADGVRLFHAGDAVEHDGLVAGVGAVDVACVPINGRGREAEGIVGNFDAAEAADLCRRLSAAHAVPLHWDMFAVNAGDPEEFVRQLSGTDVTVHVLRPLAWFDVGPAS